MGDYANPALRAMAQAPRQVAGPARCGLSYDHSAHSWREGPDEVSRCDGVVDPDDDLCPRCDQPVDPDGEGLQAPVLWEGRLLYGHAGCLADVQHERRRP
jgi:hypothetical protein